MTEEITKENNPSIYISGVKKTILSLLNSKNIKKDLDSRFRGNDSFFLGSPIKDLGDDGFSVGFLYEKPPVK